MPVFPTQAPGGTLPLVVAQHLDQGHPPAGGGSRHSNFQTTDYPEWPVSLQIPAAWYLGVPQALLLLQRAHSNPGAPHLQPCRPCHPFFRSGSRLPLLPPPQLFLFSPLSIPSGPMALRHPMSRARPVLGSTVRCHPVLLSLSMVPGGTLLLGAAPWMALLSPHVSHRSG